MSSPDHDQGSELAARFDAARERPPAFEAERMLADLGQRLFGLHAEPLRLGRFTVLRRLGAGGMGIVYLGHDAELDRHVAIKLLRVHGPDLGGRGAARLLREARALARVDHPHVVAVHEVGTHDGAVFLAMDRVEGVTLSEWQRGRSWREVVEVYVQAGRGLAAAHAAGVVHRDFKPDNVLVGADEHEAPRARVVDFGLARGPDEERPALTDAVDHHDPRAELRDDLELGATDRRGGLREDAAPTPLEQRDVADFHGDLRDESARPPAAQLGATTITPLEQRGAADRLTDAAHSLRHPALDPDADSEQAQAAGRDGRGVTEGSLEHGHTGRLTATGALLGTPAYMAPEQLEGRRADARSDQFSFAFALYEGVCGQRAFAGDSLDELRAAVLASRRQPLDGARRGPRWLHRVLDRALDVDPERRFPSMTALLDQLERGLRWRRRLLVGAGALALGVAGALAGSTIAAPALCEGGADALARVWHDDARAAARDAFLATRAPFAAYAWDQVEARIGRHAGAWQSMYREACEATHVRGDQSSAALDLRMACLDRRLRELSALLAVFAEADARTVENALVAADSLTVIDVCADLDALAGAQGVPEDPRLREPVERLRDDLARARALRKSGHYEEAFALAERAHADAERLGHAPVRAEAGLVLGTLHAARGAVDKAVPVLDRTFLDALACDHPDVAAWAAISAAHVVGDLARRGADGRRWGELAEALLERIDREPRATASLHANLASVAFAEGDLDGARARFEAALAIAEEHLGADHELVGQTLANLAAVNRRARAFPQARELYRRAREVLVARFGEGHPELIRLTNNTGALLQDMDDLDGAARNYREVLARRDASLVPNAPIFGHANNNLAEVLLEQRDPAGALPHIQAAIEIWTAAHDERHPLVGQALTTLGRAHIALRDPSAAVPALRRAIDVLSGAKRAGPLADAQFELAQALALADPGDLTEAIATAQAAAAALDPGDKRDEVLAWLREHDSR